MTFEEFRDTIKNVKGPRKHDIINSLGLNDAYKWIQKNHKEVLETISKQEFSKIIKLFGKYQFDQIQEHMDVYFPQGLGKLEVTYKETVKKFVNGKLVTNLMPDWTATLQLWQNDPEAFKNKTLIRCESNGHYKIHWNKKGVKIKNLKYLYFRLKRKQNGK